MPLSRTPVEPSVWLLPLPAGPTLNIKLFFDLGSTLAPPGSRMLLRVRRLVANYREDTGVTHVS